MLNNKNKRISMLCYLFCWLVTLMIPAISFAASKSSATPDIRLYTLDCGFIEGHDNTVFSDTDLYHHQPISMSVPCFLIKHPKGWVLWDTGLGDQHLGHPYSDKKFNADFTVSVSLMAQLKQLGLTPTDITFVGLSHAHADHTGNANLFSHATWLIQRAEYQAIQQSPILPGVASDLFQQLNLYPKNLLDGDYDIFNDSTIKILRTPGHTPGHQCLQINLPHHGTVILSGDLFHSRQNYLAKQIPTVNTNRADTMASMARIDELLKNTHGRLIIQHEPHDFSALPKFPKFLD